MEQADILYTGHGLTIMDTSGCLVIEFEDEGIQHGFSIAHDKVGDPSVWQAAVDNLVDWIDAGSDNPTMTEEEFEKAMGLA